MPQKLWNSKVKGYYGSEAEMMKCRKDLDNKKHKIRYWEKHFGYLIKMDDYDEFAKNVLIIKKIHHLHDFVANFNKNNLTMEDLELYGEHYKEINKALPIQPYLKKLKRTAPSKRSSINKYEGKQIVQFS